MARLPRVDRAGLNNTDYTFDDVVEAINNANTAILDGINQGNQIVPEDCYHNDFSTQQTNTVIITPTSGKRLRVVGVVATTDADTGTIVLAFGTSGSIIFKLYVGKDRTYLGDGVCALGAVDETVKISCPADTFISVTYNEV